MSETPASPSTNGSQKLEEAFTADFTALSSEVAPEAPVMTVESSSSSAEVDLVDDPLMFGYLTVGAVILVTSGVLAGTRTLLAFSTAMVPFALFAIAVHRGRLKRATIFTLYWFIWQAAAVIALSLIIPSRAELVFTGGMNLRQSLLLWISMGQGEFSNPALFIPLEARDLAVWVVGNLTTGGAASFYLGVLRMNDLSFAVADLFPVAYALSPLRALLLALLAWPIWDLVRVIGLAILAPSLAEPLLRWNWRWLLLRARVIALGLGVVVLGSILHVLLAPVWAAGLRLATGT